MTSRVQQLSADSIIERLPELVALLRDAVESGASVGFLPSLSNAGAERYWRNVASAVREGSRCCLAAFDGDALIGSVQIELAAMPNARHRAEVMKLMVLRSARRRGLGRTLMTEVERLAQEQGRTLILLDTRKGGVAEHLYRSMAYEAAGTIPRFAMSTDGQLADSVFFYKEL